MIFVIRDRGTEGQRARETESQRNRDRDRDRDRDIPCLIPRLPKGGPGPTGPASSPRFWARAIRFPNDLHGQGYQLEPAQNCSQADIQSTSTPPHLNLNVSERLICGLRGLSRHHSNWLHARQDTEIVGVYSSLKKAELSARHYVMATFDLDSDADEDELGFSQKLQKLRGLVPGRA